MPIETLDDIIEEVMNARGIYGAHDHDCDDSGKECHCRCCESSSLRGRIIAAVEVEKKLINLTKSCTCGRTNYGPIVCAKCGGRIWQES